MPSQDDDTYSILEYSYRDASGYAAYDCILLKGSLSESEKALIRSRLESRELFIPARVGIRPLQERLFQYSGGRPTEDDHPWHELVDLRTATEDEIASLTVVGDAQDLARRFSDVSDWESWRYSFGAPPFSR